MEVIKTYQSDTKFQSVELQSIRKSLKKSNADTGSQCIKTDVLDYVQQDYQDDTQKLQVSANIFSATSFALGNQSGARCIICQKERAPYCCSTDKCNARYCSSQCSQEHRKQCLKTTFK